MNRRTGLKALVLGSVAAWTGSELPADEKPAGEKAAAEDKDDEIPLADVPQVVRKAADAAAPKVKWETAYREEENGKVTYELEGEDEQEREVVVTVTSEGKVELVETEIELTDVPEVVLAGLKKKYPRFKPSGVYELKQDGKVVAYDFEGMRPKDKEEIGVLVSADGKEVVLEE